MHTQIQMHTDLCRRTHTDTYRNMQTYRHIQTHAHEQIPISVQVCTYRRIQTHTYEQIPISMQVYTYRHIQTHTDAYRHIQTHTGTYRHILMNRYLYLCRCADAEIQRHLRIICIIIDIRINLGLFLMGQSLAKDKNLVNFMYRKHNFFTLKNNSI